MATKWKIALFASWLLLSTAHSFYLPGVAPRDFQRGDPLYVKVNKLSSTKTQLPYDHYYLDYCKPAKIVNNAENLGEVLRGDCVENSVYTSLFLDKGETEVSQQHMNMVSKLDSKGIMRGARKRSILSTTT